MEDMKAVALRPGSETSEWFLTKLTVAIGAILAAASFIVGHPAILGFAEKVAPATVSEWFPTILAACSTVLILGSHVVYSAGRIDIKKTLVKAIADIQAAGVSSAGPTPLRPGGFENAVAHDLPDVIDHRELGGESGSALVGVIVVVTIAALLVGLVAGCVTPAASHLQSDARFMADVGRDAEGWYRKEAALPDGTTLTASVRQEKLDAVAAKRDELAIQAEALGITLTPTTAAPVAGPASSSPKEVSK